MQCYFLYPSKLLASGPSFPFYPFLGSLMCPTPISATPGVFYASQSPLLLSLVFSPWQYVLSFHISNSLLFYPRLIMLHVPNSNFNILLYVCTWDIYWLNGGLLAGIIMLYLEAKHFTLTVYPSLPWSVNDY